MTSKQCLTGLLMAVGFPEEIAKKVEPEDISVSRSCMKVKFKAVIDWKDWRIGMGHAVEEE